VALGDEVGQHGLLHRRRLTIGEFLGDDEGLHQVGRRHQEAEAQGRVEHLGEGADVDDPPGRGAAAGARLAEALVEPLQCRQRRARVAVLTVVVVLHDPGAASLGPVEQGRAYARGSSSPRWGTGARG
jgi:hypothetical protein